MPSPSRLSKPLIALGAFAVLLVLGFSVPWKLNFLRGWVGERVTAATGRTLAIDGDVWWRWWGGRLTVDRLRLSNPPWAGRADMLTAERLDVSVAYLPLLQKRLHLKRVAAAQPDVWLEVSETGQRNWAFDTQPARDDRAGSPVSVGNVQLDAGRLAYIDPTKAVDVKALLQTTAIEGVPKLQADAQGKWRTLTFDGKVVGDALLRLQDNGQPYGFTLDAKIGPTALRAQGHIVAPTKPESAEVRVQASGPSLGQWYRIAGLALPDTPPYKTAGTVRFDGQRWSYEDFTSTVGRSDLAGRIAFDPAGARPLVSGRLVSSSLDLSDFGPTLGSAPAPSKAKLEARAAAERAKPKSEQRNKDTPEKEGVRRVLPQQRFDSSKWGSMDADIEFVGKSVRNIGSFPIDALSFNVKLIDRQLALNDFSLAAGGGTLVGGFAIDGRSEPMKASVDARMQQWKLETLLPQVANSGSALGLINGRVKLAGSGDSFARQLGTANGEAQLAMGGGQLSNLLIELLHLDVFDALKFLLSGDDKVHVRCALVDVGFQQGQMQTRSAIFDTTDTLIQTTGTADFTDERLDLRITPQPKHMSPLSARVPIDVDGPFGAPSVLPDRTRLAARLGGAVALGLINPFAAILPLIETGPGKDSDCNALLKTASQKGVSAEAAPAADAPAPRGKNVRTGSTAASSAAQPQARR